MPWIRARVATADSWDLYCVCMCVFESFDESVQSECPTKHDGKHLIVVIM